MHRPELTEQYLSLLLQENPQRARTAPVMWRAIWREKNTKNKPPIVLSGSYEEHATRLAALNAQGYGIYLQVNAGQGTKAKDIEAVRALFVDCDVGDLPDVWPHGHAPDFTVQSTGGQHCYWLMPPGEDYRAAFKGAQLGLAQALGTDPAVCDLPRVMRVPGFLHTKPAHPAEWRMVGISPLRSAERAGPLPLSAVIANLTIAPAPPTAEWAAFRLGCAVVLIKSARAHSSQNTFNRVAFEIKDYVRAGLLDGDTARATLAKAGAVRGVSGIAATLESAFSSEKVAGWSGLGDDPGRLIFRSSHEEDIARDLVVAWGGPAHVVAVGGILYRYAPATGVWLGLTDASLRSEVASYHGTPYRKTDGSLSRLAIGVDLRRRVSQALLETPEIFVSDLAAWSGSGCAGLSFSNGFLRASGELVPHAPENLALWGFSWAWGGGPAAVPPRWGAFLAEIWADVDDEERALREAFLGAWFGSALLGLATDWALVVLCLGAGANGKSVLMEALRGMLPADMTAAVSPKMWSDPYYRVQLRPPVLLNLVAELPEGEWMGTDFFKQIVAGDKTGGREPYGRPQEFFPAAGHIMAANELPGSSDRSDGFWRRVTVLPFGVSFRGRETPFKSLVRALQSESQEFVRWAIVWALTAREFGELPRFSADACERENWRLENDPVATWAQERVAAAEGVKTVAGALYADFGVWAATNGLKTRSSTWWGRQMRRLGYVKEHTHTGKAYTGIKLAG